MSEVRLATRGEIGELVGLLSRAFACDPFHTYLAGEAPERAQRMRDGWTGILRFTSSATRDLSGDRCPRGRPPL